MAFRTWANVARKFDYEEDDSDHYDKNADEAEYEYVTDSDGDDFNLSRLLAKLDTSSINR